MIAIDYYRNYCPNGRPLLLLAWLGTAWSIGGHRIGAAAWRLRLLGGLRDLLVRAPFFFLDDAAKACQAATRTYVALGFLLCRSLMRMR